MGSICENELDKYKVVYIWKIKILVTTKNYYNIMVGVASIDFDINSASYYTDKTYKNYGWY